MVRFVEEWSNDISSDEEDKMDEDDDLAILMLIHMEKNKL
jgi:hypothetical protein